MADAAMTPTLPAGLGARSAASAEARWPVQAPAAASARDRTAFEAALERQAQAARSGDTSQADTPTRPAVRPGQAGHDAPPGRPAGQAGTDRPAAEADGRGDPPSAPALAGDPGPGPLARRGLDDEAQAPSPLPPDTPAPLSAALPPPPWPAAVKAPDPAPRTLAAEAPPATAARRALLAELATPPSAGAQRWQVELSGPALPVRSMAIERAASGPLTLLVSTTQPVSDHQADRLRRMLAARGAQPELRGAADPHDEDLLR